MKRKIFININIPDKTKKRLVRATEAWQLARPGDLPVKWVKEPNFHITLIFLGFILDNAVVEVCEKVRAAVFNLEIFDIEFNRIELGPSETDPKTIWITGEANDDLRILQESIEKALGIYVTSKKTFRPHITLGRIRAHLWAELPEKPSINRDYPLIITVESADVMASEFENEGQEYTIIESCPLS